MEKRAAPTNQKYSPRSCLDCLRSFVRDKALIGKVLVRAANLRIERVELRRREGEDHPADHNVGHTRMVEGRDTDGPGIGIIHEIEVRYGIHVPGTHGDTLP